ncbi:MAG: hypothetical protein IRD7MM_03510 [Candidatus Midichloria mitochondrii]
MFLTRLGIFIAYSPPSVFKVPAGTNALLEAMICAIKSIATPYLSSVAGSMITSIAFFSPLY